MKSKQFKISLSRHSIACPIWHCLALAVCVFQSLYSSFRELCAVSQEYQLFCSSFTWTSLLRVLIMGCWPDKLLFSLHGIWYCIFSDSFQTCPTSKEVKVVAYWEALCSLYVLYYIYHSLFIILFIYECFLSDRWSLNPGIFCTE